MPLPEESDSITPVKDLFTYHIFGYPAEVSEWERDPTSYRLRIDGLVSTPAEITLDDLTARYDLVRTTAVLQCMTQVHWGRVRLTGVRLADLLADLGPSEDAHKIELRGAEGFTTDLLLSQVVAHPEAFLLVHEMNEAPLTGDHGYPLRMCAIGKYAYKWCKWLTGIKIHESDFKGHYEGTRGWSDDATRGKPVT